MSDEQRTGAWWKVAVIAGLAIAVGCVFALKAGRGAAVTPPPTLADGEQEELVDDPLEAALATGRPVLAEFGRGTCIPCKLMAPILEELGREYAGRVEVISINIDQHPFTTERVGINTIPTQVFYNARGEEVHRHEGFMPRENIVAKLAEMGVDLNVKEPTVLERLQPAQVDSRPKDAVCYMCDGDINPKTLVAVRTDKGDVRLCSPHCYFIMYSCLTEDKADFEQKVSVSDYATGRPVPAADAVYLAGRNAQSGRPWIWAYADSAEAANAQKTSAGNVLTYSLLRQQELSHRCGFCDRACYAQDAAEVIAGGVRTLGCCSHCALGVAARTGLDIEVHQPDRLTGEMVVVKTLNGSVASLDPPSAVAWFGLSQKADGSWGSAGCFHQGFFANEENLREWVGQNPLETGRMITIQQALADKMKLTPQQVVKACKISECAPR